MSDVWPFHRRHRTPPEPPAEVKRAAEGLISGARDLLRAADYLTQLHAPNRSADGPPPTPGVNQ